MVYSVTKEFTNTSVRGISNMINKWTEENKIEIQGITLSFDKDHNWVAIVYYNVRSAD